MFAKRVEQLDSSEIRKMFEMVAKMKNPIDLSLGQPHFDVPDPVKEATIKAIKEGKNKYTVTAGIPKLREAIMEDLSSKDIFPEAVIVTPGATAGLVLALLALADESVDVLMTDPCFVTYAHIVRLAGASPKYIDTYPDFRLTPKHLKTALEDSKAKRQILIFNSPVNPTGVAYTAEEIKSLADTTKQLGIQVISDEVYDRYCYDFDHECWLKHDSSAVLIQTFGKTWAVTGWRTGYAAGPKAIIDQMTMLQQFTFVCVNAPAQWGSIEAIKTDVAPLLENYREKRNIAYEGLRQSYSVCRPQGAFYVFPEIPGGKSEEFIKRCIENEILIVPGKAFSRKNTHFRVSFAIDNETLKRGVDLLVRLGKNL